MNVCHYPGKLGLYKSKLGVYTVQYTHDKYHTSNCQLILTKIKTTFNRKVGSEAYKEVRLRVHGRS